MALLSGRPVLAVDPEPAAWRATERNQSLNPGPGRLVRFVLGDHRVLGGPFGLLAANLPAGIQLGAATAMAGSLAPAGRLVLSGFRREQADLVIQAFAELGLVEIERKQELGWMGLVLARD
jgi:ribosomal protein L11 methyltransferase